MTINNQNPENENYSDMDGILRMFARWETPQEINTILSSELEDENTDVCITQENTGGIQNSQRREEKKITEVTSLDVTPLWIPYSIYSSEGSPFASIRANIWESEYFFTKVLYDIDKKRRNSVAIPLESKNQVSWNEIIREESFDPRVMGKHKDLKVAVGIMLDILGKIIANPLGNIELYQELEKYKTQKWPNFGTLFPFKK